MEICELPGLGSEFFGYLGNRWIRQIKLCRF